MWQSNCSERFETIPFLSFPRWLIPMKNQYPSFEGLTIICVYISVIKLLNNIKKQTDRVILFDKYRKCFRTISKL